MLMLETKTTTTRAIFAQIDPGEPPSIALHKLLTRPDGKQKHASFSVPIRDKRLLARAEQELQAGDEVEVIVETRWAEEGIPKTLMGFSKVSAPQGRTAQDQVLAGVG